MLCLFLAWLHVLTLRIGPASWFVWHFAQELVRGNDPKWWWAKAKLFRTTLNNCGCNKICRQRVLEWYYNNLFVGSIPTQTDPSICWLRHCDMRMWKTPLMYSLVRDSKFLGSDAPWTRSLVCPRSECTIRGSQCYQASSYPTKCCILWLEDSTDIVLASHRICCECAWLSWVKVKPTFCLPWLSKVKSKTNFQKSS